jgi:tRNA-dihydrouridine synthase
MNFWNQLPQPIMGLAPMDGMTDVVFRSIVASQGTPDVMFTEFTHVSDICRGPEFLLASLLYGEHERPVVAQIYGKDPELFYTAAHVVCELGFDGLDINMGCPSRNVASSGSGAALIKTPALAHAIIQAARQGISDWAAGQTPEAAGLKPSRCEAIRRMNAERREALPVPRRAIPVSVKTRLGYEASVINRWIEHLLKEEPAAITIHGRTLAQMYRGEADWMAIASAAEIARGTATLILGNGDLQNMNDVIRRVRASRVNGVLIGRATLGVPWFFRHKERVRVAYWNGHGEQTHATGLDEPGTINQRLSLMLDHARLFESLCGQAFFQRMRKHLGWYCKGFPRAAAMRARMFQASSLTDVEHTICDFFGEAVFREVQAASSRQSHATVDTCV